MQIKSRIISDGLLYCVDVRRGVVIHSLPIFVKNDHRQPTHPQFSRKSLQPRDHGQTKSGAGTVLVRGKRIDRHHRGPGRPKHLSSCGFYFYLSKGRVRFLPKVLGLGTRDSALPPVCVKICHLSRRWMALQYDFPDTAALAIRVLNTRLIVRLVDLAA